jgi:hypothetical protein
MLLPAAVSAARSVSLAVLGRDLHPDSANVGSQAAAVTRPRSAPRCKDAVKPVRDLMGHLHLIQRRRRQKVTHLPATKLVVNVVDGRVAVSGLECKRIFAVAATNLPSVIKHTGL